MIINLTTGSLGMAIYRLLYVKAPNFVKYKIGEGKLLILIATAGLSASTFLTMIFASGKARTRAALNICLDHSRLSQVNFDHFFLESDMKLLK
jgi:hypothetical protein